MNEARQRLHAMAERVCAERIGSSQPNFGTCVDSTLAVHLKQIGALKQINITARGTGHRALSRVAELALGVQSIAEP
jgi:hypothetical protein